VIRNGTVLPYSVVAVTCVDPDLVQVVDSPFMCPVFMNVLNIFRAQYRIKPNCHPSQYKICRLHIFKKYHMIFTSLFSLSQTQQKYILIRFSVSFKIFKSNLYNEFILNFFFKHIIFY